MSEPAFIDAGLRVSAGQATAKGRKSDNEDCMGLRVPEGQSLTLKGVAAVIADGVSSAEAGREASESCVQSFLADYYSTPDSWTVRTSSQAVLTALNRWLYGMSHGIEAHRGYVSTLSALILKSHTAHVFHVGDTRIHRLRGDTFELLTRDHSTRITESEAYLSRAMGMDLRLQVDYRAVEIQAGDVFVLTTDGVHDFVDANRIARSVSRGLAAGVEIDSICGQLLDDAYRAESPDNLTCQIIRIDALPAMDVDELHRRLTRLAFPPPLTAGLKLDGYRIEKELHASSRSQLYLVMDMESGERLVMKTPSVNYEDDPGYIDRFVMEPWIGSRVASPHVARIIEPERRQSFLYYLMEYVEGPSLRQWMDEHPRPEIPEVLEIVDQLCAGLRAFQRKETLHQDLKPENVMLGADGQVKIVDFGSCRVAGIQEIERRLEPGGALGTARYSAPEVRSGGSAGIRSEIFSLGTIVYEMLTGALPFGEQIESARSPAAFERLRYTPSHLHNPMIPIWLDGALRTAVSIAPRRRYAECSELLYDLRHPNPRYLGNVPLPLIERDPLRFWKWLSLLLAAGWVATLFALLR